MKRVVFISHSSVDRPIAERLCTYLEQNGVGCWIAPRDVTPGKNYGAAIVDAIDECHIFVLILSSQSNKSRQVVREVERAASTDSIILPFRIEDVQPSRDIAFYVSAAHWLDAANYPVDEQFDELLAAIRDWQKADADGEQRPAAADRGTKSPPPLPVAIPSGNIAATPSALPPARRSRLLPMLAGASVLLVVVAGLLLFRYLHLPGDVRNEAKPIDTPPPTETTATPIPVEPSLTEPTPTPAETPTPSASASPMVTPIRLKPGERLRPTASPQPVGESTAPAGAAEAQNSSAGLPKPTASSAGGKPIVREVAASSQLNNEFRPNYAFDGNPATGWMPKGAGADQTLFVHFKSPATVRTVSILNGDGRDEDHYKASSRVKTLRIVLSDGTNQLLTFKDEMKMQHFDLTAPVMATWVKFEIVSVFPGKIKHAGISEIAFNEDGP